MFSMMLQSLCKVLHSLILSLVSLIRPVLIYNFPLNEAHFLKNIIDPPSLCYCEC